MRNFETKIMYHHIETETQLDGKLQIVYLNKPNTYNALNRDIIKELIAFFDKCSDNEFVRCVAISGKGKAFCSGQNLDASFAEDKEKHPDTYIKKIVENFYNPLVKSVVFCKKPIISLVNGPAVGAGAMLALICDFTLATKSSYFSQAFSNIGLIPDTAGTYFLPKIVGRQMAGYLAFTGKKLSADEAKQLGMIAEVFADEEFTQKSLEILTQIANLPTAALHLTKKAFLDSYSNSLDKQLEQEGQFQQKAAETEDFQEGVDAFLAKRKPTFKGK